MIKMNTIKKAFKHIKLVTKHKWLVFRFCCKIGMPFRGLVHDLSKFSPEEFIESVKYYEGTMSPITVAKRTNGYSKAWLHHKCKNKHHDVYWVDLSAPEAAPVIPYKYMAEMVCDKLSASITYNGKNWNNSSLLDYWSIEKNKIIMNPKCEKFLTEVFIQIRDNGINKTLNKKNIKGLYKKFCVDDKTRYKYVFEGHWDKVEK